MASLKHNLEYLGMRLAVGLAQSLSASAADRLAVRLAGLAHALLGSRRRIAAENMKRAFGSAYTEEQYSDLVRRVFNNFVRTTIEFSRFEKLGREGVRAIVDPQGREIMTEALSHGKGAIIVTAHFGNWELLGAWPAAEGIPMDFLVGRQHNAKVDALLNGYREAMGVGIIPLATSARSVFKALKQGRLTGMVADQHAASGGIVLNFFGRPASTPQGPALFSIRTGAPILPFLLRRERYDRHVVIPSPAIWPPNSGNEEADIRHITSAYTKVFEDGIRKYPDQWLWTHRRWKVPESATGTPV